MEQNKIVVGREVSGPFTKTVANDYVSCSHCTITNNGDGSFLFVDHSSYGSYINGEKVHKESRTIKADAVIMLGSLTEVGYRLNLKELFPNAGVASERKVEPKASSVGAEKPSTGQNNASSNNQDKILVGREVSGPYTKAIANACVSGKHCTISNLGNGSFRIEDHSSYGTYINNEKLHNASKDVKADATIMLGSNNPSYGARLNLRELFPEGGDISEDKYKELFKELESIWNNYNRRNLEIQETLSSGTMTKRMLPTMLLGAVMALVTIIVPPSFRAVLGVLSAVLTVIVFLAASAWAKRSMHKLNVEKQQLQEDFMMTYVCPNPRCRHSFGNKPWKVLIKDPNPCCPRCRKRYN